MSKQYRVCYEFPGGVRTLEADSFGELEAMAFEIMPTLVNPQRRIMGMNLDDAAREAWRVYQASRRQRISAVSQSSLAGKCVAVDAIRCYLQNMTVKEIAAWVRDNRNTTVSNSAVGRLCTRLYRMGIAPLDTWAAQRFADSDDRNFRRGV